MQHDDDDASVQGGVGDAQMEDVKSVLPTPTDLLTSLTSLASLSLSLPPPSDLSFSRALSRPLARTLDAESLRLLHLVSRVLSWSTAAPKPLELDADLLQEGVYNEVTERVEGLLERADEGIEKALGVGKFKKDGVKITLAPPKEVVEKTPLPAHLLHAKDLPKPQLFFPSRLIVPCSPLTPSPMSSLPEWTPLLRSKPNALLSSSARSDWLTTELYTPTPNPRFDVPSPAPRLRYVHPYRAELEALQPPGSYFEVKEGAGKMRGWEETPFEWVGNTEALGRMCDEIRDVGKRGGRELAIDLEHHDLRSWSGITCLIQLSTREKDYVVDVLDPQVRDQVESLNEFFTDPSWIKVFHGANSDIMWLQRDFGLYIVGLFDTYHATHVLGYPKHSLLSLLEMHTDFIPDKRYQLADWRIRPIPTEMLHYARSDTHYLLSIYDLLRVSLLSLPPPSPSPSPSLSPLHEVFSRSLSTSSLVFSLAPYDASTGLGPDGWFSLLSRWGCSADHLRAVAVPTLPIKTGWGPGEAKLEVLKAVHYWREKTAREKDEGVRYVLGNEGVRALVERAPGDERELGAALGAARGGIGEFVRREGVREELVVVVREALERVTVGEGRRVEREEKEREVVGGERGTEACEPRVSPVKGLWGVENEKGETEEKMEVEVEVEGGEKQQEKVAELPHSRIAAGFASVKAATSSFFGRSLSTAAVTGPASSKASSSALLGPSSAVEVASGSKTATRETSKMSLIATSSSMFGKSTVRPSTTTTTTTEKPLDVVARIHASLILGGGLANSLRAHSVPTPLPAPPTSPIARPAPLPRANDALTGDHSFVPFSDRATHSSEAALVASSSKAPPTTTLAPTPASKSDVVVVSAMADRPKASRKRNRNKVDVEAAVEEGAGSIGEEAEGSSPKKVKVQKKKEKGKGKGKKEERERIEPFDYNAQPSILDAGPGAGAGREEAGGKKSKKEKREKGAQKGFTVDQSEFRRAPRVNNAPKKGALSSSFAS